MSLRRVATLVGNRRRAALGAVAVSWSWSVSGFHGHGLEMRGARGWEERLGQFGSCISVHIS